jgi:hypothetical protein
MKTTKQIREEYNNKRNPSDELDALVADGLLDEGKLTLVRRALNENNKSLTNAEKKAVFETLKVALAEKNTVELLDEAKKGDYLTKFDPRFGSKFPTDKDIPQILILKRKAIRIFPDNAKVALYYAQAIDKYISIPFGEIGVGSVNEEVVVEQKYQSKKNIVEKVKQLRESTEDSVDSDIKTRFSQRLDEARQEQIDEVAPLVAGAAALAARAAPYIARGAATLGKKGLELGKKALESYKKRRAARKAEKDAYKSVKKKIRDQQKKDKLDPKKAAKRGYKRGREDATKGSKLKRFAAGALGLAAGAAGRGGDSGGGGGMGSETRSGRREYQPSDRVAGRSSWEGRTGAYGHLERAAMHSPGYLSSLKQNPMIAQRSLYEQLNTIEEAVEFTFEDGSVTVTPSMAKNMLNVYNKVNEENKKKIEHMMNESAESLKKFINFASRY